MFSESKEMCRANEYKQWSGNLFKRNQTRHTAGFSLHPRRLFRDLAESGMALSLYGFLGWRTSIRTMRNLLFDKNCSRSKNLP